MLPLIVLELCSNSSNYFLIKSSHLWFCYIWWARICVLKILFSEKPSVSAFTCSICIVFFYFLLLWFPSNYLPGGVGAVGYCRPRGLRQAEASLLPWHGRHPHVFLHWQSRQFRWGTADTQKSWVFKQVRLDKPRLRRQQQRNYKEYRIHHFSLCINVFILTESRQFISAQQAVC